MKAEPNGTSAELDAIENASDLDSLNDIITAVMARRDHQALIRGDRLGRIVNAVVQLAQKADNQEALFAAAALGRLAAVARSRESQVYERVADLKLIEPPSVETLAASEEKSYAARSIMHLSDDWVLEYLVREALCIDTAEIPRKELLTGALERYGTLSGLLEALANTQASAILIDSLDSRLIRVRRIFHAIADVVGPWRGDLGPQPGVALADLLLSFLKGKLDGVDSAVLFETVDHCLSLLTRTIELRFSHALFPDTYAVIEQGKRVLGPGMWARFLSQSAKIPTIRIALLEAALVLARQHRTDKKLVNVLRACYASRPQVSAAVKQHFRDAGDLVPDVAEFWLKVGEVAKTRRMEQKVGNSEDEQIGALLIEVESRKEVMNKLGRAIAPIIEISDPVTASTVKKAAQGYMEIAQIVRRLARIRKLTPAGLKGKQMEYDPLEHQLLDHDKLGIRHVRVVRDGIRKKFGDHERTLVKPWVEAID